MRKTHVVRAALTVTLVVVSVADTGAQIYESVGIRAQGMGGAFVAVADDATATWWNPAGLAGGAYFNALIEYGSEQDPRGATDPGGAAMPSWRSNTRGVAMAYPALGLSYYRLLVSEIRPIGATANSGFGRQDQGSVVVRSSALSLEQFGATVGQSVGEHLVVGSTVKLVRGRVASETGLATDASLERASALRGAPEMHADLDLGAMAKFGGVHVGIGVRNVRQAGFGTGDNRVNLRRQARVGASTTSRSRGAFGPVTFAVDSDLTRMATPTGDERHVAGGAEAWMFGRSLGLRGGVSANTIGELRPTGAGGLSLALRSGTYVDGEATFGSDSTRKGWGVALRVLF